jgi:hypothetical protein
MKETPLMAKTMEKNGEKSKLVPAPHREGENPKGGQQ